VVIALGSAAQPFMLVLGRSYHSGSTCQVFVRCAWASVHADPLPTATKVVKSLNAHYAQRPARTHSAYFALAEDRALETLTNIENRTTRRP